ncbi:MAG: NAD(P)H-hydrate epimerase [Phycisphaeraceae bacterium]|nr:NAD(P)H-hydrate epimerase [Phycisphaeraceae bacterium]
MEASRDQESENRHPLLTRAQIRLVDWLAIEQIGIPGVVLMENAGRGAAEHMLAWWRGRRDDDDALPRTLIACGGGNNGGDGFVVARHLHNAGADVHIVLARDPDRLGPDARVHLDSVRNMKIPCTGAWAPPDVERFKRIGAADRFDLVVDALLGTGFAGEVRPPLDRVIRACNARSRLGAEVVALDVPSGLDCDDGTAAGATIEADLTLTFVAAKTGFSRPEARRWLGEVAVIGIGAPPSLIDQAIQAS